MPQVYKDGYESLETLLDQASNAQGASLLIPDLQRPYVWNPTQVVYLVDSLVRGWPFGSLLLWGVNEQSMAKMPSRQFAMLVDRTGGDDLVVPQQQAPANYRMVLDGQQRVQSLLLAFGGDSWGFKMEDRLWHETVNGRRQRSARYAHRHWSAAELCVDLTLLQTEFAKAKAISAMEFAKVLRWVIRDPKVGQSSWHKKSTYEEPLPYSYKDPGRYVRLSRLWSALKIAGTATLSQLRVAAERLLAEHQVQSALAAQVTEALMEVLQALQEVKRTRVTFLEVFQYNPDMGTPETYSDAVVSIFTRLNTAGRTLTREEITFAWVKVNWDATKTKNRGAAECFRELCEELEATFEIEVSTDDLVSAVSLIWAVHFNSGRLLSNADLLKGESVRPMARQIAEHWDGVVASVKDVCAAVWRRGYRYGDHYQSLNSIALLWAWRFMGLQWQLGQPLRETDKDAWSKTTIDAMNEHIDRWLVSSQWAGIWGDSATASLATIVNTLTSAGNELAKESNLDKAAAAWRGALTTVVESFAKAASDHIETLDVDAREFVRAYYLPLWIWHRLDASRWAASSVPLRTRKSGGTLDVDHVVSIGMSQQLGATTSVDGIPASDLTTPILNVNALGNCWLLETNFNISKGKQSAASFLEKVIEFKADSKALEKWRTQIGLDSDMLAPTASRLRELAAAIDGRTNSIRSDLKSFIAGKTVRVDLAAPNT